MTEFTREQQESAYRAAKEVIEKARAEGATELNLSSVSIDPSGRELEIVETAYAALVQLPSQIAALTGLQTLRLHGTQVSDLSPLATLNGLQLLRLDGTQVSDLSPLVALTGLQFLRLDETRVSDLYPLATLTGLQTLGLDETPVSDLSPLASLTELEFLSLKETQVTDISPLAALTRLLHLWLNETLVSDLSPLTALTGLKLLWLNETQVSDLSPLATLTGLHTLRLNRTLVSDLSPLATLIGLQDLTLADSAVRDLRPLLTLTKLGTDGDPGLTFADTPATRANPALQDLSLIEDPKERAEKTLAYLATLPPWPEPLEPHQPDAPILTVEAVLKSQSPLGWRFSPADGAMEVYAEAVPTTAMQEQLAQMSRERAQTLKSALAGANHGLRGEARVEVDRFSALLEDGSRALSVRSVELWGSLVALGGLLDGSDVGRVQGRDPLDLLSVEQRAALQTLLQIAGNFVRSFPDVKVLDDSAGGFLRRSISIEMVSAMIEAALRATYVTQNSAALMQHVAAIGVADGPQADKATSVSVRGIANLIKTATLLVGKGSIKLAGAAALGAAGYVGKEAADHYDLDQAAITYIEEIRELVDPFLSNMSPDEAAVLNSALHDAKERLNERARLQDGNDDQNLKLDLGRRRTDKPPTDIKKS